MVSRVSLPGCLLICVLLVLRALEEQISKGRRYGSRRLYGELRRKGVSEDVARGALEELSPGDEAETARRQAERLLARKDASDPDVRRKAIQALVRRGFGWDIAREAVKSVSGEETDET